MKKLLSKVPKDRREVLEAAGFTWHPMLALWFNRERRKIVSHDAVMKRDADWLQKWAVEDEGGNSSIWFEEPPPPEVVDEILFQLGW